MRTAKEEFKKAQKKEDKMVKPGMKKAFAKNEKVEHKALEKMGEKKAMKGRK